MGQKWVQSFTVRKLSVNFDVWIHRMIYYELLNDVFKIIEFIT